MKYDWKQAGEEWSEPWGTSDAQWNGTILPRIRDCLPTGTVLEIAPGFGRWTHYLKDYCSQLYAVDKSSECIEACRERFAADSHVRCYLNDGRSLSMIRDSSIDFVFSFDSFVHPDREILEAYLHQLRAKLKIGAKGFIHHSNFGEYVNSPRERLPEILAKPLIKLRILDWAHHRNPGMTAALFRDLCAKNGLHCISQELVNWRGARLIDCLSLFVRSDFASPNASKIMRNPNFMREAARIRRKSRL
ncbi:MAG TPA: class I SAM-dependent methyltransferase [Candidatus Udaeobacter sp.]|jgi:SAM-dependent methyltransferase|nr:class I SAM-dependent methyltransferase [Candidatus Udaeobacter sp.]